MPAPRPPRRPLAPRRAPGALPAALALSLVLASAGTARAATLLEVVGNPPSVHPFAGRLLPGGPEAAYFNPALLAELPQQFTLGLFYLWRDLDVDLRARPAGADVPDGIYGARVPQPDGTTAAPADRPLATSRLPSARGSFDGSGGRLYLHLGAVMKFWKDRIALGFLGALPAAQFQAQRPFFPDEREQAFSNSLHFERLGDRLEPNAFVLSLAVRPIPQISLGAGVRIANGSTVTNEIYIPESGNQGTSVSTSKIIVKTRLTGHFGLSAYPWKGLRLAATAHLEEWSPTTTRTNTRFWTSATSSDPSSTVSRSSRTYHWEPLRVGFGAGWDGGPAGVVQGWRVGVAGLWGQWSRYRDRLGERPADRWRDTVSLSAGGEVTVAGHRLAADLAWDPSPVPDQRGRSNYVDLDRVGGSLSWDATWPVGRVRLGVGVALQAQGLLSRAVTKDPSAARPVRDEVPDDALDGRTGQPLEGAAGLQTNNPGWPGWRASGWMLGGGVTGKVHF